MSSGNFDGSIAEAQLKLHHELVIIMPPTPTLPRKTMDEITSMF